MDLSAKIAAMHTQFSQINQHMQVMIKELQGFTKNHSAAIEEEVTLAVAQHTGATEYAISFGVRQSGRPLFEADGVLWLPDGSMAIVEAKHSVQQGHLMQMMERMERIKRYYGRDGAPEWFLWVMTNSVDIKGFIGGPKFPLSERSLAKRLGLTPVTLSGTRFQVLPKPRDGNHDPTIGDASNDASNDDAAETTGLTYAPMQK